ncbi:MAG: hypothetical protein ACOX52_10440 [Verrucomicrobiota bacterium]
MVADSSDHCLNRCRNRNRNRDRYRNRSLPWLDLALMERLNFAAERGQHRNSGTRLLISEFHHASILVTQVMSHRNIPLSPWRSWRLGG